MEIYLDNAATTKITENVKDAMINAMVEDYGNPSSKHTKGMEAETIIKEAKADIAKTLKCQPEDIIFTSGGTESNNMALIGTALANKRAGNHIITTRIEHPSVYEPLGWLEKQGFCVTYLPVDKDGKVQKEDLQKAITDETILVSIMYVNNEIGALQDIPALSKIVHETNPSIVFHVDAIQAYGKRMIHVKKEGIDLLSVSGHKIHGPKGVGFLYKSPKVKMHPILFGGGQQKGMRSGTENVPGIAGLAAAVKEIYENYSEKQKNLLEWKKYFVEKIQQIPDTTIHGISSTQVEETATHIVSVGFEGIRSEVLLHALAQKGIFVSSGSACSSNHPEISGTLKAIGAKDNLLDATLRFSANTDTTIVDCDYVIDSLNELLPVLRRYVRH